MKPMNTAVVSPAISVGAFPSLLRFPFIFTRFPRRTCFPRGGVVRVEAVWEEKPYEILAGGLRSYLDEDDVASFLDPPRKLVPIDPDSFNPAIYLWKKIGDIPEERRHHLLYKLKARHIAKMWEITGARYEDVKLAKQTSSTLLSLQHMPQGMEVWCCRTKEGPLPVSWMNDFNIAIFCGKDGGTFGKMLLGGLTSGVSKLCGPLYFQVKEVIEVMATEQPCDLAFDFGNGVFNLGELPEGFPKPAEHSWPFNDSLVIYIRHAGPGVSIGQAWQEGKDLEQVPQKFCGEILMIKDHSYS